jgi:hypothetical protein
MLLAAATIASLSEPKRVQDLMAGRRKTNEPNDDGHDNRDQGFAHQTLSTVNSFPHCHGQ